VVLGVGSVQAIFEKPFVLSLSPFKESALTHTNKAQALEIENLNVYLVHEVVWDFRFGGFTFVMFENGLWVVEKDRKFLFFDGLEML